MPTLREIITAQHDVMNRALDHARYCGGLDDQRCRFMAATMIDMALHEQNRMIRDVVAGYVFDPYVPNELLPHISRERLDAQMDNIEKNQLPYFKSLLASAGDDEHVTYTADGMTFTMDRDDYMEDCRGLGEYAIFDIDAYLAVCAPNERHAREFAADADGVRNIGSLIHVEPAVEDDEWPTYLFNVVTSRVFDDYVDELFMDLDIPNRPCETI